MKLFITGATGFLGKYIINELVDQYETIYVLSRQNEIESFKKYKNIVLIQGDITHPEVIDDTQFRNLIIEDCEHIIHAAALYEMQATHESCYLQNVVGTQNVVHLVKSSKKCTKFYYISTIAVADNSIYLLEENDLPQAQNFNDHYSKTKYLAEKFVREHLADLSCSVRIIRPGIIVGDSLTGKMDKLDGPYFFINSIKKNQKYLRSITFLPLSYNPRTRIPMIPVDHCANLIGLIIKRDKNLDNLKTYHLISDEIPTIQELLEDLCIVYKLKIKFIPIPMNFISSAVFNLLGIPKEVIPFMFSKTSYDKTHTNKELPEILLSKYTQFKDALLKK